MLFDLRGRGRRRTVRVIYSGLALLMGGGLVLFGVGSFGGTGILNNIGNETTGGASFAGKIKKYQQLTRTQPNNPAAWEKLAEAQLGEAGSSEAYVTSNGITAKGKELYEQTAQSWASYQALHPAKPSVKLAKLMYRVFGEEGLNKPGEAVPVLQIIVAAEPNSPAYFVALAKSAYQAHDTRVGDLAAKKAVSLVPAIERPRIRSELAALRNPTSGATTTTLNATKGSNGRLTVPAPTP